MNRILGITGHTADASRETRRDGRFLSRLKFGFVLVIATLIFSHKIHAQSLDIGDISTVDKSIVLAMISNWDNAETVLRDSGVTDPARIRLVADLIPEMLADILFLEADIGPLADVQLVIAGSGEPALVVSLRGLPLYQILGEVFAGIPQERLVALVQQSGLASAIGQATEAGADLEGTALAVSAIGVVHDGNRLRLEP